MAKDKPAPEADASGVTPVKRGRKPAPKEPAEVIADADKAPETVPPTPSVPGQSPEADASGDASGADTDQDPGPDADQAPEVILAPVKERVYKIESEDEAREHFHTEGYKLPDGENVAFMTADGNVFFQENRDSGAAHARQFKMPFYQIQP